MKRQKGFTLIEVLIVVVIIAVLAALILPRFMSQTERAVIAEAQQQLGAMRRGEMTYVDMTQDTNLAPISSCGYSGACTAAQWGKIGMRAPTAGTGKYDYVCSGTAAAGTCVATRANSPNGTYDGSTVTIVVDTGVFTCGGSYTLVNAADSTKGCTAA